jgi:hypothetical protein
MASPASAQQGPPQATLNWTAPAVPTTSALSYVLERATAATGPWNTLTTIAAVPPATAPVTTYIDTAVTRGTTYWWRVSSSCPASGAGCGTTQNPMNGNSTPSASASGTIPNATTNPPSPSNLTITLGP